jgi:hypothetical protein
MEWALDGRRRRTFDISHKNEMERTARGITLAFVLNDL